MCPHRIALASYVRTLGQILSAEQKIELLNRRRRLQRRIDEYEHRRTQYLLVAAVTANEGHEWEDEFPDEAEEENPFVDNTMPRGERSPECMVISLPSTLGMSTASEGMPGRLAKEELELRMGQANDALHQVRMILGQKSFMFRTSVRGARSQQKKTRAWTEIEQLERSLRIQARVYMQCRRAIAALGADEDMLGKYKTLSPSDLKVSTAVVDPNMRGQRLATLPWFWSMDVEGDAEQDSVMEECTVRPHYFVESCNNPVGQFIVSITSGPKANMTGCVRRIFCSDESWIGLQDSFITRRSGGRECVCRHWKEDWVVRWHMRHNRQPCSVSWNKKRGELATCIVEIFDTG